MHPVALPYPSLDPNNTASGGKRQLTARQIGPIEVVIGAGVNLHLDLGAASNRAVKKSFAWDCRYPDIFGPTNTMSGMVVDHDGCCRARRRMSDRRLPPPEKSPRGSWAGRLKLCVPIAKRRAPPPCDQPITPMRSGRTKGCACRNNNAP